MTREPKNADSGDFGRFEYISFPKIMILGIVVKEREVHINETFKGQA